MEDKAIIELFFARSEQAIGELDRKYGKVCYKISFHIVNSRQDAEECVNDAYLGAWNAIPPARPHPLLTFLCKLVRNISVSRWRVNAAQKRAGMGTCPWRSWPSACPPPPRWRTRWRRRN